MSSMWNAAAETALLNRIASLETSRTQDEAVISSLSTRMAAAEAAIKALQAIVPPPAISLLLNHDLSTGDLSQYTHKDYGLGTDVGGNASGAGFLNYHANVAGRRAAGLTATPTAQASPAAGSDSVYLWDPVQPWGYSGNEWWMRFLLFFPSAASAALLLPGEAPFEATTGEWNWLMVLHNSENVPGPSEVSFGVLTDYPVTTSPGANPRLRLRLDVGSISSPTSTYKEAPALLYDHWYDVMIHEKLDPAAGILEWYLDGALMYQNLSVPTLFTGDSAVSLTMCNYRLHATWNSTFFVGPLVIAKSQADALAAF